MKVAVVGAGVMGPGIAQVFMQAGHEVTLTDIKVEPLEAGVQAIKACLGLMRQMDMVDDDARVLQLLTTTTDLAAAVKGAQLVVEAIPEVPELKMKLYGQLDAVCDPGTVIVSNTSAFPLPEMMPQFRPGDFFVAHFFNPPAVIPLVEIVKNDATDAAKVAWLRGVLEAAGKKPIVVNGFVKGFLVNRMQTALAREALHLLQQGVVSADDLETASVVGIGFKTAWQGLFETMDNIGLDTVAFAYQTIYPDLCDDAAVPSLVTEKVAQGKLGLKTGEGFLRYGDVAETEQNRLRVLLEQLKLYNEYGRTVAL